MKNRVAAAGLVWGLAIFASRLIGLVRDAVLGHHLGVSPAADVYQAAFRIPDWFQILLAGGALSIVFIPIVTAHLERGDDARGWRAFSHIANFLVVVMAVVGTAVWLATPLLATLLAPGFDAAQHALLVQLTRIILPAQAFFVLGGLLSASLLARDQHAVPALAPLVYTLCIIVGGLVTGTPEGFAWGVLVGAIAGPFLLPFVAALRQGLRWQPILDTRDPDLRLYLSRWVPVLLGGALAVLDDTLLARFGSTIEDGAIATLGYAKALMRAPMGIFGAAMGFAAYPALTRLALAGDLPGLHALATTATRRVLILAFLSQVGLTACAPELATLVYGTHRISPDRMRELGTCLALFSLGLGPWSAQIMLSRAFYAQGKGWVPARLGLLVVALFVPVYWVAGRSFGAPGLAVASSALVTTSVVVLSIALRRETGGTGRYADLLRPALVATCVGIAAGLGVRELLGEPAWTRLDASWRLAVLGCSACGTFLAAGLLLRMPELREAMEPVVRRIRRYSGRSRDVSGGA